MHRQELSGKNSSSSGNNPSNLPIGFHEITKSSCSTKETLEWGESASTQKGKLLPTVYQTGPYYPQYMKNCKT